MSGFRNQNIDKAADFPKQPLCIDLATAINLTGAVVFSFTPGYKYQIARIESFCRVKAGTVTAVVKVGGRTAASITFTSATEVAQALSATLANIRGSATDAITVELTTDGTGALTNGNLVILYRPWPLNRDIGTN